MNRWLFRALFAVAVLSLFACLPTPRVMRETVVRETVVVRETASAQATVLVTQPPLPTYTSFPTYTPYPTYTIPPAPTHTPAKTPTKTLTPPGDQPLSISKNLNLSQDSAGLIIELRRVVVADKLYQENLSGAQFAESSLDPESYRQADLVGEFIFVLRNTSDKTLFVYPDQGTVTVEGAGGVRQIDLTWSPINVDEMDNVGGEIRAADVKVGGFWYPLPKGVTMADVQILLLRFDGPNDARFVTVGPEYIFEVDLTDRPNDPYNEAAITP